MSKSILQDEKQCFISGAVAELDRHHVYAGSRRKDSEKWGCWVWLRHDIHMDLHDRGEGDKELQALAEKKWIEWINSIIKQITNSTMKKYMNYLLLAVFKILVIKEFVQCFINLQI